MVEAEFIRPRKWIESLGRVKGARIDLAVTELEIDGLAEVTAVRPCPPIAEGEGRVVTGRFVTRDVANVVRITLANGTEIRATDVHPIWSVDREDWVPAGKLETGEHVATPASGRPTQDLQNECCTSGTGTGTAAAGPSSASKPIEEIQVGDFVWARDEHDPSAPAKLEKVVALYRSTAYDLQPLVDVDGLCRGNSAGAHQTPASGWRRNATPPLRARGPCP